MSAITPWLLAMPGVADEVFEKTHVIDVPGGPTSFDIGFIDPVAGVYVLADRTNKSIDVVDTTSNTLSQIKEDFVGVGATNDVSGPDGVPIVNHTELWVGDGNSTVWVLHWQRDRQDLYSARWTRNRPDQSRRGVR